MAHQLSYCRCGNPQHWPANARIGDIWTCRRCGQRTRLVAPGTPGARTGGVIAPSRAHRSPRTGTRPPTPLSRSPESLARRLRRLLAALGR